MARIKLSDDGTLDTVLVCKDCGEEFRFNYCPDDLGNDNELTWYDEYKLFVRDSIREVEDEHECGC